MPHNINAKPESSQVLRKHPHLRQNQWGKSPCPPGQKGLTEVQMLLEKAEGQDPSLASLETVRPDSSRLQPLPGLSPESQRAPRRSPARVRCHRQICIKFSFASALLWVRGFGNRSKLLEKNNSQISWGGSQANPPPRGRRWSNESVRSEIKRAWKAFQAA